MSDAFPISMEEYPQGRVLGVSNVQEPSYRLYKRRFVGILGLVSFRDSHRRNLSRSNPRSDIDEYRVRLIMALVWANCQ